MHMRLNFIWKSFPVKILKAFSKTKINPHCVKIVLNRSSPGLHFPAFELYSVQKQENADQNISEYGHFLRSVQ